MLKRSRSTPSKINVKKIQARGVKNQKMSELASFF